jgi:hypothetical protein
MNSIAKAINNVALSLGRIAIAIETKDTLKPPLIPTSVLKNIFSEDNKQIAQNANITSNPGYEKISLKLNKRISSMDSFVSIPAKEKEAIDDIYNALLRADTNANLKDISDNLKANWYSLWTALEQLKTCRTAPHRHNHDSHNIWK